MAHYFTVEAATPRDVIFAYRGTDEQNSLPCAVPPDGDADGTLRLPATMLEAAVERYLADIFFKLAAENPGFRILVRLAANNLVTAWIMPLP